MANTGDYGGECVIYAGKGYFGKRFGVDLAKDVYTASTVRQLSGPKSGCIACWSSSGAGHVGVVESWDSSTKKMTFSDSNRNLDKLVVRNVGITESEMKGFMGSSYTFQGYVEFK